MKATKRMAGRTAVVTGAAQGIGRAIVDRFLAEGAAVFGVDIAGPLLEETASASPHAARLASLMCDLTQTEAPDSIIEKAVASFGGIDILVNNAGIEKRAALADQTDAAWQQVLDVNLTAPFRLARTAAPYLARSGRGAIVNIASVAIVGFSGQASYDASKGGLQSLTRSLAVELGPQGIRANCVCPGFIATAMVEAHPDLKAVGEKLSRTLPIARMGRPAEIAAAVAWLASDASSYVTGHSLFVDGGWLRR